MRAKIYFLLRGGDLTVQARRPEDDRLLQFVPGAVFVGDFPNAFVNDHVHWLDLGSGEVEFRPAVSPWTPDPCNWRLSVHTDGTRSSFSKSLGDSAAQIDLIDIHSPTFEMISRLLSAIESPRDITITYADQVIEASLSRLRIVFFVNQNLQLECRSMPGYVVDDIQSCGTMIGLNNKLVLRPSSTSSDMPRRVIIPQGKVEFNLNGDFSRVSIKTETARNIHWHEYTIDTDLGRLTGNVSLHSKLYQCYLHAITSHCLPDPLLGHTGTEESLTMLQSAAFLSFQRLGEDDVNLLLSINALAGQDELPILSQHYDFHPAVLAILDHARAIEALYPTSKDVPHPYAPQQKRTALRKMV